MGVDAAVVDRRPDRGWWCSAGRSSRPSACFLDVTGTQISIVTRSALQNGSVAANVCQCSSSNMSVSRSRSTDMVWERQSNVYVLSRDLAKSVTENCLV